MSSTDDRIVRMHFDNASFKKGAADTQKSLADLDKATSAAGKSRGLMDMSHQMEQVSVTASKMSIATTAALATIASKATSVALNLAKGLTLDPIKQGFTEYEELLTKQNVIMNATGKSAREVKTYLNDLNTYSDETIYSFSNMTASITKFVNAGISLPQSVKSIKGIANAAAFAGATTEEANRAMYAFSQSMSTGFMMLNDWMQIENANMATMGFKEELLKAGVAAGTLTQKGNEFITSSGKAISATKGWREGLQEQWATTEVMNSALAKYTDLNTKLGREATEAATEVRTFTAFMDTLKESLGSGWAAIFTALIGNLEESTKMWTALADTVGGGTTKFFDFLAVTLKVWRSMGGFEKTIQGFKNIIAPFAAILGVLGDAWQEAFPDSGKGAGKALYGLSAAFEAVTRPLQWLADLISGATPIMTVFFKAMKLGGTILGNVTGMVIDFVQGLLGLAEMDVPSAGGFVSFIKGIARAIGDAITKIDELIQKGASIGSAFGSVDIAMPNMPDMPDMPAMPKMPTMDLGGMFSGGGAAGGQIAALTGGIKKLTANVFDLEGASDAVSKTDFFNPASDLDTSRFTSFSGAMEQMVTSTKDSTQEVETLGDKMGDAFNSAKDQVASFLAGFSFEDLVSSFNLAVLATMVISISRFFNTLTKSFRGFVGVGESITNVLDSTASALGSFQTAARAKLILNVAIALGILALSLLAISFIPVDKLIKGLAGLTGVMLIMAFTMKQMTSVVEKLDGKKVSVKMIALSVAIMALGAAMMMLSTAMLIMNLVDWTSIAKGLIVMFVTMKMLESLGKLGEHAAKNLIAGAAAIALVAGAMIVLATALLMFKMIDWESMGKAGATLAGLTLAVGALALIPYAGISKVGVALLAASAGMLAIANALIIFGLVEWESIGKAAVMLAALTVSLGLLMFMANPMSVGIIIAMAGAMLYLSFALKTLNGVDWSSIGKMALVMGILIAAFAGFLAVVTLFGPALVALSAFAGSLALLALALTGLALAFAVVFPLLAAGAGVFAAFATGAAVAFAVFLQTLAAEAPVIKKAFLDILQSLIDAVVEAVPMIINGIKRLWNAVIKELTGGDKKKATNNAGKGWVASAADGISANIPQIVKKGAEILIKFLVALTARGADLARAGVGLIVSILKGIASKIGDIVKAAVDLVVKFAKALGDNLPKLVKAGIDLIVDFLHALAGGIRSGAGAIGGGILAVVDALKDVGIDMVKGLISGIGQMADDALNAIGNLAGDMVAKAKNILDIFSPSKVFEKIGKFLVQGLTLGIQNNAAAAIVAVATMVTGQIALSEDLINDFIQRLDQKSIAARSRAEGLADAAKRAQQAANKTKGTKTDDRAANQITKEAKAADKQADKAEKAAKKERDAEQRRREWEQADSLGRAKIRAQDAANQLAAAKEAERNAEAARVEANALDRMARAKGLESKQRKSLRREADRLRKEAREEAEKANESLDKARDNAAEAMEWQAQAGAEAAAAYQKQFADEAKADADAEAFAKLTSAEKARQRREEAAALQAQAEANLADAKQKAYSDIEAANAIATLAMEQADRARDLLREAQDYEGEGGSGQVLDLRPTDAAALAFNSYADLYDAAYAAAARSGPTFNQYNTSPESLSASEIYRQTNNLVTFAADKVSPSAA